MDKLLQRRLQLTTVHRNREREKRLVPVKTVGTLVTDLLINKHPAECFLEHLLPTERFQILVELIGDVDEEFKSVLLFAYVDRFTPQFEVFPEVLRAVVLSLTFEKVTEDVLHLVEYTARLFRFVVICF